MARIKNPLVKKANVDVEFTAEQVEELRRCSEDPVYLAKNYIKVQHPTQGAILLDLRDYQEDMIISFKENRFVVVLASRQSGKALWVDEKIPTPTGWTTMGEIKVGDNVLGSAGKPVRVIGISDTMKNHDCYEVCFSNKEKIIADGDHLWEVIKTVHRKTTKSLTQMLSTKELLDSGLTFPLSGRNTSPQSKYAVKITKPLILPKQNLSIDPYVLGVWLGDGDSQGGSITTHQNDIEIINNIIDKGFEVRSKPQSIQTPYVLKNRVVNLTTILRQNGLLQNKHIPQKYLRGSYQQRLELLQGLMDTDGYISKSGACELSFSNERLANDAHELICSLGLKATLRGPKKTQYNGIICKDCYPIGFSPFRNIIPVFKLKRKLERMKLEPRGYRKNVTFKREIRSIIKVNSVPVKCIKVDSPDSLFLAGKAMVPTHNTSAAIAYILWFAMFNFDKFVLIVSNKNTNAMEIMHRVRYAYENLPDWLKPGVTESGWNKHSIEFDNGSRIVSRATTEDAGRTLSVSLLYADEFAFVRPGIQDEFWTSMSPTLSTGGDCIMTSTPNGDMDIFAQIWRGAQSGINGFAYQFVHWTQVPGRDEQWKKEEIGRIGERRFNQEHDCIFLSSEKLLIDTLVLQNLTELIVKSSPLFELREIKFWKQIETGKMYLVGVDPATGTGNDFSIITVFEFPTMEQVAEYRSNTTSSAVLYTILKNLLRYIEKKSSTVYFSVENNGVGEGIIALYEADENPPELAEFIHDEGKTKRGMTTTPKTKLRACVKLKQVIESNTLHIKSPYLLAELKAFVKQVGGYKAQLNATDDCVSATLIVMRILEAIAPHEQDVHDTLYSIPKDEWEEIEEEYDENNETHIPMPMVIA